MRQIVDYDRYYRNQLMQRGGNVPYFAGARYQRGHGLGQIFSSLKSIFPTILKTVAKHAIPTFANMGIDMMRGMKLKDAANRHAWTGAAGALREMPINIAKEMNRKRMQEASRAAQSINSEVDEDHFVDAEQYGSGVKRRRKHKVNKKRRAVKTNKRAKTDIFY